MKQQTKSIPARAKTPKKPATTPVSGVTTLLRVDLWSGDAAADPSGVPARSTAAQMISDLVLVTSGELHTCSDSGVSAAYKNTRQAVAAVRQMRHLIKGYSGAVETGPIHAAFTLRHAEDAATATDGDTPAPKQEPETVFLIGDICTEAKSIPGLRFKEAPANGTKKRAKILELLPPTHAAQSTAVLPVAPPAPAPVASAPPPVTAPKPAAKPEPAPAKVLEQPKPAPTPEAPKLPTRQPAVPAVATASGNPNRSKIIGGSVAAGIAAIILLFVLLKPSAKAAPGAASPTPATTTSQPAQPVAATTENVPAKAAAEKPAPARPKAPPPVVAKATVPEKPKAEPKEVASPEPPASSLTYSSTEISQMIAKADKLSGDGSYDRAIVLYNTVLRQDRHNEQAQKGLERATRNRDQQ